MANNNYGNLKFSANENLNSRFYEQRFPAVNDLVMVEVLKVDYAGIYVCLLEYNRIEGLIMLSDFTKKRIKSINQLTRVGRKEVVAVIRVDESKNYLDLSKTQVTADDISECEKKYQKAKSVNSILRHVAQTTPTDIQLLYKTIAWPLYEKFEHALDAFRLAVTEPDKAFEGLQMTAEIRESLLHVIRNRLTPQPVRISAEFSVSCYEYEGIDSIKKALAAGRDLDTEKIKIRLIAAPWYSLVLTTVDKVQGIELANACLEKVAEVIQKLKGRYLLKESPRVIELTTDQENDDILEKRGDREKEITEFDEEYDETMGDADFGFEGFDKEVKILETENC